MERAIAHFAFQHDVEVPLVVTARERIAAGHIHDLLVILELHVALKVFEHGAPHADLVAVFQLVRCDALPIHVGAIGGLEIRHDPFASDALNNGVLATDQPAIDRDGAFIASADLNDLLHEIDAIAEAVPLDDDEARLARARWPLRGHRCQRLGRDVTGASLRHFPRLERAKGLRPLGHLTLEAFLRSSS